jgi:prolipoprotein diacylglyceryltransferase
MNKESVFFDLIPYEVGIIILAGFVMMVLLTIKNIKDKNKICQRCQNEIENHK